MTSAMGSLAVVVYLIAALSLLTYGLNCYVMIVLFERRREKALAAQRGVLKQFGDLLTRDDLPVVTTQIPVYNEMNVLERVVRAVCAMRYAPGKHEIQILDDSTDATRDLVDQVARRMRAEGHDVCVVRRADRVGFKAGALAVGMQRARGELIAIFDADFVPPEDYLLRTVPFFLNDPQLGLVQARWGHLNRGQSLLTRAQSVGIDGHFMVEQSGRAWNGLFMNFNGTAGTWRRTAIEAGGGWRWDTLTEDMDLSYRTQLAGWRAVYLPDLVVPAELPADIRAFKSQQFRWAKGSIQTALKLLPVVFASPVGAFAKLQAFFHLTHYLVHPLMLLQAVLALPVLLLLRVRLDPSVAVLLGSVLLLALCAPSTLYVVSQRAAYDNWRRRILVLPALVVLGVGLAISNTRAVFEAFIGKESEFVRTPKRGDLEIVQYRVPTPWGAIIELLLGLYCSWSFGVYVLTGKWLIGAFLGVYSAGFLFSSLLTLTETFRGLRASVSQKPMAVAGIKQA